MNQVVSREEPATCVIHLREVFIARWMQRSRRRLVVFLSKDDGGASLGRLRRRGRPLKARRRCFQTRSNWLPRTKTSQGPRAERKKFSPSCTAFQLKSGRNSLAAVVHGCRLIPVLGSPERQVCLTVAVGPGRRVSLTLCRNEDAAVSFL